MTHTRRDTTHITFSETSSTKLEKLKKYIKYHKNLPQREAVSLVAENT